MRAESLTNQFHFWYTQNHHHFHNILTSKFLILRSPVWGFAGLSLPEDCRGARTSFKPIQDAHHVKGLQRVASVPRLRNGSVTFFGSGRAERSRPCPTIQSGTAQSQYCGVRTGLRKETKTNREKGKKNSAAGNFEFPIRAEWRKGVYQRYESLGSRPSETEQH